MEIAETATICGIVFVAALVRSTLGFGEALIAMPLLALVIPLQAAAPLVALVSVCNGVAILIREWQHVNFKAAVRLTVPAVVSVPLGVWLLRSGDDRIAKGLLAFVILVFSSWSLVRPEAFACSPMDGHRSSVLSQGFWVGPTTRPVRPSSCTAR